MKGAGRRRGEGGLGEVERGSEREGAAHHDGEDNTDLLNNFEDAEHSQEYHLDQLCTHGSGGWECASGIHSLVCTCLASATRKDAQQTVQERRGRGGEEGGGEGRRGGEGGGEGRGGEKGRGEEGREEEREKGEKGSTISLTNYYIGF